MKKIESAELVTHAHTIMHTSGLKVTPQRTAVFEALVNQHRPTSVYDLRRADKKIGRLNPITIYRILEVFARIGLAHRVSGNEFTFCGIPDGKKKGCHQFLICDERESVTEVTLATCNENDIARKYGFRVFDHVNEIHGLCKECGAK